VRQKLGCAKAAEYSPDGAEQHFRNGIAIWRDDMDKVVALRRNGTWTLLPDPWDPCHCNPPLAPELGWPITGRLLHRIAVQDFDGGSMFWTPGSGFYVLYNDGTWQHYD
jgi:hypothetical protein